MSGALHCPFCGTEFDIMKGISDSVLGCPKCKHIATIGVWEALIDGKKAQDALKVATDCIENIGDTWRGDIRWTNDDMDEIRINIERYCDSVLKKIKGVKNEIS